MRQPQLPPQLENQYTPLRLSVAYFLIDHDSRLTHTYTALRSQNDDKEWFWLTQRPNIEHISDLLSAYQQLPLYVQAVEHNSAGTSVFWREHGELENIDEVHRQLKSLNLLIH